MHNPNLLYLLALLPNSLLTFQVDRGEENKHFEHIEDHIEHRGLRVLESLYFFEVLFVKERFHFDQDLPDVITDDLSFVGLLRQHFQIPEEQFGVFSELAG